MSQKKSLAVIKVGGDVLLDEDERLGLANNIADLHQLGWNIIVLHGGGPQVNELQRKQGLKSVKIAGRRVTSKADLQVVKQGIAGEVNVNLVSALLASNLPAFGCHGASGLLIEATKRPPIKVSGEGDKLIDFGEVGEVTSINTPIINGLLDLGLIPVIATLGASSAGQIFNINADTTVVQIARSMKAELLLLITKIGGIYIDIEDPTSLIELITPTKANQLIETGIIKDGMIPKVEEAIKLLNDGVKTVAIAAARRKGLFRALALSESTNLKATKIQRSD